MVNTDSFSEKFNLNKLRLSRVAITSMFISFGIAGGTWASRIPQVRDQANLSNGDLGFALLFIPVGVTIAIRMLGKLSRNKGSRAALLLAISITSVSLLPLAFCHDIITLIICLFILGFSWGLLDVSMNTQAAVVEHLYRRTIMSSFHAFFSLGSLIGSGIGAFANALNIDVAYHFAVIAILLAVNSAALKRYFITSDIEGSTEQTNNTNSSDTTSGALQGFKWTKLVILLCLIAFGGSLCEGTAYDWSGVYATDIIGTNAAIGAIGLSGYSLAMCAVRFFGDRLIVNLGSAMVLKLSGLIIGFGFGVTLLFTSAVVSIMGWIVLGIGVSLIVPTTISQGGKIPGTPRAATISRIAGIGWIGSVTGPPVIGLLAQSFSLKIGLLLPVLAGFSIASMAVVADAQPTKVQKALRIFRNGLYNSKTTIQNG